jgi:hypothetical protein
MPSSETERALNTLDKWGRDPASDGGETIVFSLSRQGAPSDALLVTGDCTPYAPSGNDHRGTLKGQPAGDMGAPVAYYDNFSGTAPALLQIPCTFSFDLATGTVTLIGTFPGLATSVSFTVHYLKEFVAAGGKNLLFYSPASSDDAGYVIAMQLVGAG